LLPGDSSTDTADAVVATGRMLWLCIRVRATKPFGLLVYFVADRATLAEERESQRRLAEPTELLRTDGPTNA